MKKFVNFSFCAVFVLAVFLAAGCKAPSSGGESNSGGSSGLVAHDIVTFGSFPQSKKDTTVSITSESKTVGSFTYYKGDDNEWYAELNSIYYKVEPIKWCVLTTNYNGTGKTLLLAENVLINCKYYDYGDVNREINSATTYPNNYEHSKIRAYLNGLSYQKKTSDSTDQETDSLFLNNGFLQTAFTEEERTAIAVTTVINNARSTNPDGDSNATLWRGGVNQYATDTATSDKIFLLSLQEVTKAEYGFAAYNEYKGDGIHNESSRMRNATAFAEANGAYQDYFIDGSKGCYWWLRSPSFDDSFATLFIGVTGDGGDVLDADADGYTNDGIGVDAYFFGVVPALCLN